VSFRLLRKIRPDVAIGVGGYASGPLLRMAALMGIPTAVQEQNSYPGITNRVLGRKAKLIFTAYPGMEAFFPIEKTRLTGNPVRQDIIRIQGKKEEALTYFGLKPSKPVILIIGGSQGARSFNEAMEATLGRFDDSDRQWIWQTGKDFCEKAQALVDATGSGNTVVKAFIDRMDLAYAAADIIISRAGAIAISELCNIGKPVILVPFPHAAANHQEYNARRLEASGAALLIKDNQLRNKLFDAINNLLADTSLCESLSVNIRQWAQPDADTHIARMIIDLVNQNNTRA
jgi:UDP-N-acetylglucosamine--N-acetylmuramyl-(pentapeptide) pyrophosphoryl-undecaprenol N-acetylglucosamine transferase